MLPFDEIADLHVVVGGIPGASNEQAMQVERDSRVQQKYEDA